MTTSSVTSTVGAEPVRPLSELVAEWISGWVVSRAASEPAVRRWGWTIDVGMPNHVARHVIVDADESRVRDAARQAGADGWWLKVFLPAPHAGPEELVGTWLGTGWAFGEPGFLMSVDLEPVAPGPLPAGYELRTWTRGGLVRVMVVAPDGALAARGQAGLAGDVAVPDQIQTEPAHRRRGLGSVVMHALQQRAHAAGATRAVLGATTEGRALYESLGWRTNTAFASAYRVDSNAAVIR